MEQFDRVDATFTPKHLDTLRPEAIPWVGHRDVWEALWFIDDGPYAGQWAMGLTTYTRLGWVPLEDLTVHGAIDA